MKCLIVPRSWDGQPAVYIDKDGVRRCRRCQRPVKYHEK